MKRNKTLARLQRKAAQTGKVKKSKYRRKAEYLHKLSRSVGHRVFGFEIPAPKPYQS